eukprot:CCRYP_012273-RA/>CCRYP_012273-RA protein AED:0.16 eAED:0.17 QI:0/-1/0/1/-1/1/1/0/538
MSNPRVFLTGITASLLVVLVYINIHALQNDAGRQRGTVTTNHNAFYRILQQSIGSGGVRGGSADGDGDRDDANEALDEEDTARVKEIQEKIPQLKDFLGELDYNIHRYAEAVEQTLDEEKSSSSWTNVQVLNAIPRKRKRRTTTNQNNAQSSSSSSAAATPTNLNILLLYADDWTHHTLSSFHKTIPPNPILQTPTLDALASDGVRFTHNCVTTSVCWISRATLYTGQYMSRHGTTEPCCWNGMDKPQQKLEKAPTNWDRLSVYELLSRNGYHVGHAGKWGVYLPWPKNVHFNVEDDGWHYRQIGDKLWHITEKNEADALRFLVTRPRDKPFFLNVAFFATHAKDSDARQYMPQNASMSLYENDTIPIPPTGTAEAWSKMPPFFTESNEGRTRWRARFKNFTLHQSMMKNYYRMATEVDSACGAILEELRRQDALNNTVIIFTTDNGNFHSEHGLADKWYPHQESIRVPLIVRDPRMKEEMRGTTNDAFTLNIDLAPTILGRREYLLRRNTWEEIWHSCTSTPWRRRGGGRNSFTNIP